MSKVSQHTFSICMPQFLFGLKNMQSNVAVKTSSNKISFENIGYIPISINKVSDLVNPFCLFKQISGLEDVGNV